MTSPNADLRTQLQGLMESSDGVKGLRLDGKIMGWEQVIRLYLPAYEAPPNGRSETP